MTRIRKFFTKEMLTKKMNKDLLSQNDEDNVPLSTVTVSESSSKETEKKRGKRKKDCEEMPVKKKKKLEWKLEDCAQPIGEISKFSGKGKKKKCHYKTFKFHGKQYGLEDSVILVPEDAKRKPYVAIIKDIYIPSKGKYVKLSVQWFYRPEDVDQKHLGNWESNDSRNLFYSFHRDEVFAESVKQTCVVSFVPENKQVPTRRDHPAGFIVQHIYDFVKKKLRTFTDNGFGVKQKQEIDHLVAKTISRLGDLPDMENDQVTKTSSRKRSVELKRYMKAGRKSPKTSNMVNPFDYKSILKDFDLATGDSERDKRLEELLEAVKHECRTSKKKKAGDYDSFWPNDVVPVVRALEKVLYDSLAEDISKYNHKLEILVNNLKNSRLLASRLLSGELKPEQVLKMTHYELTSGFTFDEITADLGEPILKKDAPSTSKSAECKDFLEGLKRY